ncbi:hypothetical protein HDV03_004222 [Kappamyces sp. JEL0829]|nr:hypothetical protein HDV03_004222 [Kappamyces sp. JEL0829]
MRAANKWKKLPLCKTKSAVYKALLQLEKAMLKHQVKQENGAEEEEVVVDGGHTTDPLDAPVAPSGSLVVPSKVALMQRAVDGTFYFSSAVPEHLVDGISKREISKIRVLPTAESKQLQGQALGTSSQVRPVTVKRKSHPVGIKYKPVDFLDYGVFTSFAPSSDARDASLSSHDSLLLLNPNRTVEVEASDPVISIPAYDNLPIFTGTYPSDFATIDVDLSLPSEPIPRKPLTEADIPAIKEVLKGTSLANVDVNFLLQLPAQFAKVKKSKVPSLVQELFTENQVIIATLLQLQKARYLNAAAKGPSGSASLLSASAKPSAVPTPDELELELANTLQSNLAALARWSVPGHLSAGLGIDNAIGVVKKQGREPLYRGVISSGKRGVASNVVGQAAFALN